MRAAVCPPISRPKSKGWGMHIVLALATQLNAELTVERRNNGYIVRAACATRSALLKNSQTVPQPRDRDAKGHNAATERNEVPEIAS